MDEIEIELTEQFSPRKEQNFLLSRIYRSLGLEERSSRVEHCGDFLGFVPPADPDGSWKLHEANFCKDRFCSMCGWRRSLKVFGQVSKVMDKIQLDYQFLFVTFTLRNVPGDELPDLITHLTDGFKLLMKYNELRSAVKGYFKALEVTKNHVSNTYHPHFHCIFAVGKDYFKHNYISFDRLRDLWKRACGVGYLPQIFINKIRPNPSHPDETTIGAAVSEVAKYAVKSSDYLGKGKYCEKVDTVSKLMVALAGRRLCSFGGIMKKVAHDLKLDDLTDGDLIHTNPEELRNDVQEVIYRYRWVIGFGYTLYYSGGRYDSQ